MSTFPELGLSQPLLQAIADLGFEETTPIQKQTIPLILQGKDVIGQAQTGTGKTAAFGIPMMERVDPQNPNIQALVVAPTRELAVQVAEELNRLGRHKGVLTIAIYGGQDIQRQIRALKKRPQVIAATPGRLLDHLRRRTVRLQNVQQVVLDEADEMLNMGFVEDIEAILQAITSEHQTMLFSATMPDAIRRLGQKFMQDPVQVSITPKDLVVPSIEQYYLEVPEQQKFDVLCRLLDMQVPELAMVFGRTKRRVDELTMALVTRGYSAEGIHGDLTQVRRDAVMHKFRSGTIDVLVATDVAARGLDVTGITHVYNFDVPQDPEWYVHRIGRTGRAGNTGIAVTFVTPREVSYLHQLERMLNLRIERRPVPSLADAVEGQLQQTAASLLQTAQAGDLESYKGWAEQLLAETDSVQLLAAALKILTREPDLTPVRLTAEAPVRSRRDRRPRGGGKRKSHNYRGARDKRRNSNNRRSRSHAGGKGGGGNRQDDARRRQRPSKTRPDGRSDGKRS